MTRLGGPPHCPHESSDDEEGATRRTSSDIVDANFPLSNFSPRRSGIVAVVTIRIKTGIVSLRSRDQNVWFPAPVSKVSSTPGVIQGIGNGADVITLSRYRGNGESYRRTILMETRDARATTAKSVNFG